MNERDALYIFLKWKQLNQQERDARLGFGALTANYIFFLAKTYGFIVHRNNDTAVLMGTPEHFF